MKKAIYTLLIFQCVLLSHNCSYGQSSNLNSVTIKFVGFTVETIADVSCDAFEYYFHDVEKDTKFIFNPTDLIHFQSLCTEFKPVKPLRSFDVRGSVNFIHDKTSDKYCFNTFGYFYKDGKYYFNKTLMIYIIDKLYRHHPTYLDTLRQYE